MRKEVMEDYDSAWLISNLTESACTLTSLDPHPSSFSGSHSSLLASLRLGLW